VGQIKSGTREQERRHSPLTVPATIFPCSPALLLVDEDDEDVDEGSFFFLSNVEKIVFLSADWSDDWLRLCFRCPFSEGWSPSRSSGTPVPAVTVVTAAAASSTGSPSQFESGTPTWMYARGTIPGSASRSTGWTCTHSAAAPVTVPAAAAAVSSSDSKI